MQQSSRRLIASGINAILILLIGCIGKESNALDSGLDMMFQNSDMTGYENSPDSLKRTPGQLWFGPRLGRGKRIHQEDEDQVERFLTNDDMMIELMKDTPMAFVSVKGDTRNNFTPRLGRESGEVEQLPAFSPKLGRHLGVLHFGPRLGRHLLQQTDQYARRTSGQPEVELDIKH